MYIVYKMKNILFYGAIVSILLLSFYIMYINTVIEKEFQNTINKSILMQYEIYKKNKRLHSFSIENKDYIDTSDMINEYKQITPLVIDEKINDDNKDDISFVFYDIKSNTKMQLNKKISTLKDEEYFIRYNDHNQVILFGQIEDKGYVQIVKNIKHLKTVENDLLELNLNIFLLGFINLVIIVYLIFLIKKIKLSAVTLNEKFEKMYENTKKLAFNDKLTKAATRLKFDVVLEELVDVSTRFEEHKFSVIMVDIDNFKKVNDSLGHDYGDFVLKSVAQVILQNTRQSDTFARWGGEEFVIIVPLSTQKEAYLFADKIRQLISEIKFEKLEQITCSFGVAEFQKGDDEKSIMKRADEFLYRAKKNGKNRVEY